MANIFKPITQEHIQEKEDLLNDHMKKNGLTLKTLDPIGIVLKTDLDKALNSRRGQLRNPVNGPALREIDRQNALKKLAAQQSPATTDNAAEKQVPTPGTELNKKLSLTSPEISETPGASSDPTANWVAPHNAHYTAAYTAANHLSSLAYNLQDEHNLPDSALAPIHDMLDKAHYHLSYHAKHNEQGDNPDSPRLASQHLNSAVDNLVKVSRALSAVGGNQSFTRTPQKMTNVEDGKLLPFTKFSPLPSVDTGLENNDAFRGKLNALAVHYGSNYGEGNVSRAPAPRSDAYPHGGTTEDSERFIRAMKGENITNDKDLGPKYRGVNEALAGNASDLVKRAYADEISSAASFSPLDLSGVPAAAGLNRQVIRSARKRLVGLHTTGVVPHVVVTARPHTSATEVTPAVGTTEPKSVDPEQFPVVPKDLKKLNVGYTATREYNKRYGKALAKRLGPVIAQEKQLLGESEGNLPSLTPSEKSKQELSNRNARVRSDIAKTSLFPNRPGFAVKGKKEEAVSAVRQAMKWFSNADAKHASPENGFKAIHETYEPYKAQAIYAQSLPGHLRTALGPFGIETAVESHLKSVSNREKADLARTYVPSFSREEEERPETFAAETAKNAIGLDVPEPSGFRVEEAPKPGLPVGSPARRGGRGGSMAAFRGE